MQGHRSILSRLPDDHGTYALIMTARDASAVPIGRRGEVAIGPGWYVYVGSAFGPGGLAARVGRHLVGGQRIRWHVDYLRAVMQITAVLMCTDAARREHGWARRLIGSPGAVIPMRGFGSSDCRCPAHLVAFASRRALDAALGALSGEVTWADAAAPRLRLPAG